MKLPVRNNFKNDIIKDISDETTKLTKKRLINEISCVSCKRLRKMKVKTYHPENKNKLLQPYLKLI